MFLKAGLAFLEDFEIGEDEFGLDGFDVARGVDAAVDVDDVLVFEESQDVDDGGDFADIREEFIAETFAFGRAADESRDVIKFDGGRDDSLRVTVFGEDFESRVGDFDESDIGVDGAERIVLRIGTIGDGVKRVDFPTLGSPTIPSFILGSPFPIGSSVRIEA